MPGRRADRLRREVALLVVLVAAVEALFLAGYLVAGLWTASAGVKLAFTVLWTGATLAVGIRQLTRIRSIRAGG